ncbi:MAG: nucleotidyltransferase domain-containing protein [Nanoarchaeota archaeon]|nr:nucleotidyltransferase domain-containing protein [Nanoarchaeota archaeon]
MTLKEFLKNNKETRKIFGKKEIDIILNQLDGIQLTQSERNRLSRDIRPKLNFIKEISKFRGDFNLKKNADNLTLINKAVELILEDSLKEKIISILLFGSHVKGTITKRSDIDICVVFKEISQEESDKFRIRLLSNFSEKVDIQVFNTLPQKIKREIAKKHRILYKTEDFNNMEFTINYLKDEDYFIRTKKIMGEVS